MYGLFKNEYDYYEWRNLVCVSSDREKLVERAANEKFPLLDGDEQEAACNAERIHYVINEIEVL